MPAISPLAPARFPDLPPIAGVRLAACEAGVRYSGRQDLMLAELASGSTVAGVFTHFADAESCYRRAVELNPAAEFARLSLGEFLLYFNRYGEATEQQPDECGVGRV